MGKIMIDYKYEIAILRLSEQRSNGADGIVEKKLGGRSAAVPQYERLA